MILAAMLTTQRCCESSNQSLHCWLPMFILWICVIVRLCCTNDSLFIGATIHCSQSIISRLCVLILSGPQWQISKKALFDAINKPRVDCIKMCQVLPYIRNNPDWENLEFVVIQCCN